MQVFIQVMEGESDYNLLYQSSTNPLIANLGLQTANFCKFLIKLYEDENKLGGIKQNGSR
jgi:hypothetical protein